MNINQPGFLHSLHLAFDDFNLLGFPVFKDVFLAAHRAAAMSNVARIMNLQWHCQKTFNTKGSPWETAPQISRGSKSRKKRESFLGLTLPLVVSHVIQDLPCSVSGKRKRKWIQYWQRSRFCIAVRPLTHRGICITTWIWRLLGWCKFIRVCRMER